ncbi:Nucleoporin [Podosphaera aphanis]|nr:Nucleoporin [Podosphaera aphanis]
MSETPRLRSSYPTTPNKSSGTSENAKGAPWNDKTFRASLPDLPQASLEDVGSSSPVIPVHFLDAPSQRMYISVIYAALWAYRLYDWWSLIEEDVTSITLFVKWCSIDIFFLFGVPFLRIPWMEWSDSVSVFASLIHIFLNGLFMFRVQLPIEGWLLAFMKTLFDRELSISENSVRPSSVLHNASLIMGKQIINILPEGSVTMNPDRLPFCLDSSKPVANIPLYFNQTTPKHVELLRIDFDTNTNETIILSQKELKNGRTFFDESLMSMQYAAKKPGLYRLHKVIDNTKLEVQRRMSDTVVVKCPRAVVKSTARDKCLGDLSDLTIDIHGTPPLKVVYSRTANGDKSVHHFQSIQPDNFVSPLVGSLSTTLADLDNQDVSWGKPYHISVPLNESMMAPGPWLYSIDQIHDAAGNVINFSAGPGASGDDGEHIYPKGVNLEKTFTVHERPMTYFRFCDPRNPLMVAKGNSKMMPVEYIAAPLRQSSRYPPDNPPDTSHLISWKFSPLDTLTKTGDHSEDAATGEFSARSADHHPIIHEEGLYTLTGVRSKHCEGIVKEPASCVLLNPPEPKLTISAKSISDTCAGNSIGLLVDLNLIGSPPFIVHYDVITPGGTESMHVEVHALRHQLELRPTDAGHFKYQFTSIDDQVYKNRNLREDELILEQDVKPPASAELRYPPRAIEACVEEPVQMGVRLSGEKPFVLTYEIIHDGKRKKSRVDKIDSFAYTIKTDPLLQGGDYILSLTSVEDKTGCKIFLNSEAQFTVRRQRPKAAFGKLEGRYKVVAVDGKQVEIPLRLSGRAPWSIKYRMVEDPLGMIMEKIARSTNDMLQVNQGGRYEMIEVSDDQCPGTVDPMASSFEVDLFPRPQVKLADTTLIHQDGEKFFKREDCEGDIDSVKINLLGSPPYNVKYQVRYTSDHGSGSIINKEFEAGLGSATIPMDTSQAGKYEYRFIELSDALYDHDAQKFSPLVLEHNVNRKPTAYFTKPGQSYKYCQEELYGDEVIPIKLEGIPPFSLEVDIKHQSNSRPETVNIANIETTDYEFQIPHRVLSLGIHHVSIRKVQDSHGCQQKMDYGGSHVQVQVHNVPTIYPVNSQTDYCVGDRIAYTLSGVAPFEIFYDFEGIQKRAKSTSTTFKRFAEKPGIFTINAVSDKASECKAKTNLVKVIHAMPSVRISKGRQIEVDIHEGAEAEILFEFSGTPPFQFTYTRSTNVRKGQKSQVLETRHEKSDDFSKTIRSSQEGTYEVVSIKDKFCSFSTQDSGRRK